MVVCGLKEEEEEGEDESYTILFFATKFHYTRLSFSAFPRFLSVLLLYDFPATKNGKNT